MTRLIRMLALVLSVATISLVGAVGLGTTGTATAAPPNSGNKVVPVTGTASDGGTFNGQYTITQFQADPNAPTGLAAVATLTGTVTTLASQTANQAVTVPVQAITGSCQILDLTLGPLHLDLLGLVVDLNQVHLQITAQQGAGNLLGNLLCAVANLLNNTNANVNAIVNLLNQILGALSGAVG